MVRKNRGEILIVGPVAIDTIAKEESNGGTAANMSYGLGILGLEPMLFSSVGVDFLGAFEKHLKKCGVDLRVHIDKKNKTAHYYDVFESSKRQNVFHLNAYKNIAKVSLDKIVPKEDIKNVTFAVFSSSTSASTVKHIQNLKKYSPNAIIIFDPGREIINFSRTGLTRCMNLCDIFIVNENEYKQAKNILKKDLRQVFKGKIIIETLGEKGSIIFDGKKEMKIKAIRPKCVVDTTGAGDAYRAGLIFGLWKGFSLKKACTIGARLASKNVEYMGCQRY